MSDFDPAIPPERKVAAVAIAIVRRGDTVLICQRKPEAVLGGLWEFPGGKIEPNESAAAAAEREVREELAIDVRATEALEPIIHDYPHATIHLTPFICEYLQGSAVPIGCAAFRWVHHITLNDYTFPEANSALLASLTKRFG